MNLSPRVLRYRRLVCSIWNDVFIGAPEAREGDRRRKCDFNDRDRWAELCALLFYQVVWRDIMPGEEIRHLAHMAYPYETAVTAISVTAVVREPLKIQVQDRLRSGGWRLELLNPNGEIGFSLPDLLFVDFHDWNVLGNRDLEYVKAMVSGDPGNGPLKIGDVILLEVERVEFWYREQESE
jgi:hypothetical protein